MTLVTAIGTAATAPAKPNAPAPAELVIAGTTTPARRLYRQATVRYTYSPLFCQTPRSCAHPDARGRQDRLDEAGLIETPRSHVRGSLGLWRGERGNTAVEFALILPALVLLTLGTINLSLMMWAVSTLHYAVEDAARCGVVKTTICTSPATTATYAAGRYKGPLMSPVFNSPAPNPTAACGYQVTGSATYNFVTGLANIAVPISATACRPLSG